MNITNIIFNQVRFIKATLEQDLNRNESVYTYFFCESQTKFLDIDELQAYIETTKIENYTYLVEILNTCRKIISLWNENFKNVPYKKLDYHFSYSNNKGFIFSTDEEFRTILLEENKIIPLNNNHGKNHDFGNYEFTDYTIDSIIKKCGLIINWITAYPNQIALPPKQVKTKTDKISAPALGLFCNLIHRISIDKREETESAQIYCERICKKYELTYTDRVRQNYNVNETKKLILELSKKILPLIDEKTKSKIQEYLDNKNPSKENLYA